MRPTMSLCALVAVAMCCSQLASAQSSAPSASTSFGGLFGRVVTPFVDSYHSLRQWFSDNKEDLNDAVKEIRAKAFEQFLRVYNKTYNGDELKRRLEIFSKHLSMVNEWNEKFQRNESTFTLKTNRFSDLTDEELDQMYGLKTPPNMTNMLESDAVDEDAPAKLAARSPRGSYSRYQPSSPSSMTLNLPQSVDWRTSGCLTAIRDQRDCGCCYAFATLDAVSASKCIHWKDGPKDLAPQQIVDCGKRFDREGMAGCDGGWPSNMLDHLQGRDIALESSYPYRAREGYCKYSQLQRQSNALVKTGYSQPSPKYRELHSDAEFKYHLANTGPVITAMHASSLFNMYNNGVLDDFSCGRKQWNHAVLTVGYGRENGQDYWLIRNSYGPSWGDRGYAKLRAGRCKIGQMGWVITKN